MTVHELRERARAALERARAAMPGPPWRIEPSGDRFYLLDAKGFTWAEFTPRMDTPRATAIREHLAAAANEREMLAEAVLRLMDPVPYRPGQPPMEVLTAFSHWMVQVEDGALVVPVGLVRALRIVAARPCTADGTPLPWPAALESQQ